MCFLVVFGIPIIFVVPRISSYSKKPKNPKKPNHMGWGVVVVLLLYVLTRFVVPRISVFGIICNFFNICSDINVFFLVGCVLWLGVC